MADDEFETDEDLDSNASPIDGPPELVRTATLQRAYWTHDLREQAELEAKGVARLSWRERLRLHHLVCLQRALRKSERATTTEKCREALRLLTGDDSPYRPRTALVWQGRTVVPGNREAPKMQGVLMNASLTHLGCLEVCRLDGSGQPSAIDFVSFDELSGIGFATPSIFRAAKLFFENGGSEIVLVPLLYGLTWRIGSDLDRAGQMTRFVAHVRGGPIGPLGEPGIGVGQQDLTVQAKEGGQMFGLGSVAEIMFPLDMRDPNFDAKARARGIDPDEARKRTPR